MIETTATIETARTLAQEFATRAAEADRQGVLPREDVQAMRDAGFFALSAPTEYGGPGLSLGACVAALLELAQGSTSSALVAVMPLHVFGYAREIRQWPEAMFAQLCRDAVHEGALLNNVASEPQLGSPSRGGAFQTHATPQPQGDGWVVNGHKTWTTGGRHITHMLVRLQVEDDPGLILVPQDTPGVTWKETWRDVLSLRASDSHDVFFTQVEVPPEHLLERGATRGPVLPNAWFPLLLGATYLGAALAARQVVDSICPGACADRFRESQSRHCRRSNGRSAKSMWRYKRRRRYCWKSPSCGAAIRRRVAPCIRGSQRRNIMPWRWRRR